MANKKKARLSTDAEFVRNRLEVHSKRVVPDPQTLMMLFDIASRCQRILQSRASPTNGNSGGGRGQAEASEIDESGWPMEQPSANFQALSGTDQQRKWTQTEELYFLYKVSRNLTCGRSPGPACRHLIGRRASHTALAGEVESQL